MRPQVSVNGDSRPRDAGDHNRRKNFGRSTGPDLFVTKTPITLSITIEVSIENVYNF